MTTIQHQSLTLLPIQQSHVAPLVAATEGNHDLWNFMFYGDLCDSQHMRLFVDRAIELRDAGTDLPFTVLNNSGRIIGSTRIRDICHKHRKCEIGATWFAPSMQRTGANLISKYLLLKHAFEALGMLRVQFKTDIRNNVSRKSLERLGAIQEGILRQSAIMPDGVIRDTVIYSILSSEWLDVKENIERRLARHDARVVYDWSRKLIAEGGYQLTSSPRLKPGDSSSETAMSCRENIPCCIDISIMQCPTVGASPFSYSKSCSTFRTVDRNTSATRTGLGTVRFVDFEKHALHRFRFCIKLCFQH